jgi:hypothetical protein
VAPALAHILASLAAGGALLYETFADGQQLLGRPSRPEFLLQPAELLARCAGLHVLAFEQGRIGDPAGWCNASWPWPRPWSRRRCGWTGRPTARMAGLQQAAQS